MSGDIFDRYIYFGNCVIKNVWEFMHILKMLDYSFTL